MRCIGMRCTWSVRSRCSQSTESEPLSQQSSPLNRSFFLFFPSVEPVPDRTGPRSNAFFSLVQVILEVVTCKPARRGDPFRLQPLSGDATPANPGWRRQIFL